MGTSRKGLVLFFQRAIKGGDEEEMTSEDSPRARQREEQV